MIHIVRGEKADAPVCSPHCDLSAAIRLAEAMEARGSTVRIFSGGEDGAETMLPTYEEALAERDALLTLLDRVDYDGKSLQGELREDIGKALDAARKAGWRRA